MNWNTKLSSTVLHAELDFFQMIFFLCGWLSIVTNTVNLSHGSSLNTPFEETIVLFPEYEHGRGIDLSSEVCLTTPWSAPFQLVSTGPLSSWPTIIKINKLVCWQQIGSWERETVEQA